MKLKTTFVAFTLVAAVFSSCSKESDEPIGKNGKILITTMLANPDGWSGSAYMQLIDNLDPKTVTNAAAIPIAYGGVPIVCGDDVFSLPGWGGAKQM